MTRPTVLGISVQSFLHWVSSRTGQAPLLTTVNIFACLFYLVLLMVMYPQIIYNYLPEVSVDDILSQVFIIMHTSIHIYMHTYSPTHTHIPTHITFCLILIFH